MVVQARLGSTRLPRKVLADIGGRTLLERVVDRASLIGYPVCVAIPPDVELALLCAENEWTYVEGSETDVLGRYADAARALRADHVVRVTADCPFLDVEAARWTVEWHHQTGADFTHHVAEGRAVQVLKTTALLNAEKLAPGPVGFYRDSPDEWILHSPGRYHIEQVKFSVDTEAELETARLRAAKEMLSL